MIDNAILNHALGRSLEEAHEQMHFAHRQFPMGENKLLDNFDIVTNITEPLLNSKRSIAHSNASKQSTSSLRSNPPVDTTLSFFPQAKLLIYKNVILTVRNPKNIIFLVLMPFLLSLLMFVFQDLSRANGQRTLPEPPVK